MTVSSVTCSATRTWTGAETLFSTGFAALDPSYCSVKTALGTLVPGTHYSAELAPGTGELIIRPLAGMPLPPQTLTIERQTPALQTDNLTNGNNYDAEAQEQLFDRMTMVLQEARRDILKIIALSDLVGLIEQIIAEGPVLRVNGRTGDVLLSSNDVGLANVDNTADALKPLSAPQALAIEAILAADLVGPSRLRLGTWAAVTAAATIDLGAQASRNIAISGPINISSFGSAPTPDNLPFTLRFNEANTIIHSSNLLCPGYQNMPVVAGAVIRVMQIAAGVWVVISQTGTNYTGLGVAVAALGLGAIGQYGFFKANGGSPTAEGNTVNGGSLVYSSANSTVSGVSPSGIWRAHGRQNAVTDPTLFQRVS